MNKDRLNRLENIPLLAVEEVHQGTIIVGILLSQSQGAGSLVEKILLHNLSPKNPPVLEFPEYLTH